MILTVLVAFILVQKKIQKTLNFQSQITLKQYVHWKYNILIATSEDNRYKLRLSLRARGNG